MRIGIPDISSRYPKLLQWIETLFLTLIIPFLGWLMDHGDPLFLSSSFPWIWFGPLLAGLRYGIAPALFSVITLSLIWFAYSITGVISGPFPRDFMLGGALLSLVSGQFCSVWIARLRRADQLSRHAEERFQQISRAYFMVRLSHDRLEQNLISRPVTLRQGMMELRGMLAGNGGRIDGQVASDVLSLLSHYCTLGSASVYAASGGRINPVPVASCGAGAPYIANDLLLITAMESGHTAYQTVQRLKKGEDSSYLVAAPMRTSSGMLVGMLLVSEMPFMALQRENLQIMGVLLAYTADNVESSETGKGILGIYPDCPPVFASELVKMVRLKMDLDVTSSLVLIELPPSPRQDDVCQMLERMQRGLDHGWKREIGWNIQFLTLMPFSGPAAVEGYQKRIDEILKRQFHTELSQNGLTFRFTVLSGEEPVQQLAGLLVE